MTLFIVDENRILRGTVTDGDIRRALIKGVTIDQPVNDIINPNFKYIKRNEFDIAHIKAYKNAEIKLLPLLDSEGRIIKIKELFNLRTVLPADAIIMAGGKGQRLRPLTETVPKPMLTIGNKPILEHNIDRLVMYGVNHFKISVNYLGEQIMDHFGDGSSRLVDISYIEESKPLGTIGSVSLATHFYHDVLLIMNSDILTTIDFEHFFEFFESHDADMAIATVPYEVKIPYAVLETSQVNIVSFKEKPTYTYYSNAGIYLLKTEIVSQIPKDKKYDITELMDKLIEENKKVISYPIVDYWLDIGRIEDYNKAREDIWKLNL